MIATFRDSMLEMFWRDDVAGGHLAAMERVLRRKLTQLDTAPSLDMLRIPPANRLEALSGKLRGYCSIRVNDQWRLVFRWVDGDVHELALMDYH